MTPSTPVSPVSAERDIKELLDVVYDCLNGEDRLDADYNLALFQRLHQAWRKPAESAAAA